MDRKTKIELLIKAAVLCNDQRDPLEMAMLSWALRQAQGKLSVKQIQKNFPRLDEIPFGSEHKYIATLHRSKHDAGQASDTPGVGSRSDYPAGAGLTPGVKDLSQIIFLSGAPEVVLKKSKIKNQESKRWGRKFKELGSQGYRIVGFAYKEIEKLKIEKLDNSNLEGLVWLGVLVFEDPVRAGAREALEECRQAGIRVKVITGDYLWTAKAVMAKLGLLEDRTQSNAKTQKNPETQKHEKGESQSGIAVKLQSNHREIITGDELEKMSDEELNEKIGEIILFARTTPEQKLRIVEALKAKNEVVAMTGDGVNDAPALARADIGIVVDEASDVSKQVADMVLLDSNFQTIVKAVEEGRTIFENIRKVVLYLLSDSFTEVVLVGGSLLLGLPLPVAAVQILWVNLVEDSLPAMALALEPEEKEVMEDKPRPKRASILDGELKFLILIIGGFTSLGLLGLFFWLQRGFLHLEHIQTVMFIALGIDSLFYVYACRSLRKPFFRYNLFSNRLLNLSVLIGFVLLVAAVYFPPFQELLKTQPLNGKEWLLLLAIGLVSFMAIELAKWVWLARQNRGSK